MFKKVDLNAVQERSKNTMIDRLGIEFTEIGEDYLCAKMPVDERTVQVYGILHGGASVTLAETLGSFGSVLCVDSEKYIAVGLEINANHIRSVTEGFVYGRATVIHRGKSTHIWDIKITNEAQQLVCISRHTVAILPKKS